MDLRLQNKIVVVTGGASGIGAACVESFAAEEAIPVIVGRSPELGEELIARCGRGHMIAAELTSEGDCREAIDETLGRYGRIDGIVHNAGTNDGVSLRHDPREFVESLRRNVGHVFTLTHHALDALIESRGFIVNITSKVAQTGQGNTSGYAASKGALDALTREWALDLAEYGIRVNAVAPAEVLTASYQNWVKTLEDPDSFVDEICSRIPLGRRMTTPEEIANLVIFLASDRSAHTTGQIIYADGGYVHLDRAYGNVVKAD